MNDRLQSLLIASGAAVFLLGMLAGFPFTLVVLGTPVGPGDVRGWRMAHLEGILNGLLLIAVAAVAPRLRLAARTQSVLAWSLLLTAWANTIASFGALRGMHYRS
jgi:hypothetical protein